MLDECTCKYKNVGDNCPFSNPAPPEELATWQLCYHVDGVYCSTYPKFLPFIERFKDAVKT